MKNYSILLTSLVLIIFNTSVFSQSQQIKERYVKFTNEDEIFVEKDGNIEVRNMFLCNILESESSKPAHIAVNELSNVVKFGIRSKSENIANERSCYVIMNPENYISTFRQVLYKMEVKYVLIGEEFISTDKFYTINK